MDYRIEKIVGRMGDEERARTAAEILNGVDPTRTNMLAFFDALGDTTHGELTSRAADQTVREG